MKPAADISVDVPEKTIQPIKTGALKVRNTLRNTAMGAIAAFGLASSAQASTVSDPTPSSTNVSGSSDAYDTHLGESRLYTPRVGTVPGIIVESTSRLVVTISGTDAPNGGTLTVSGYMRAGTGGSFDKTGSGFKSTNFSIDQSILGSTSGGPTIVLASHSKNGTNGNSNPIESNEGFDVSMPFSFDISIPSGGIDYYLDNYSKSLNTNSTVMLSGDVNGGTPLNFNFTPTPLDSNQNGMADVWEMAHLHTMESPADGDPDGDGLNNLTEFALDTDPLKSNPSPLTYTFETHNGNKYLSMAVAKNPIATTVTYTAEVSSDLAHWSPATEVIIDATHSRFEDTLSVSQSFQRFIRLKVYGK